MKKLLLCAAIAVFGLANVNAQEFKGGVNVGLPTGLAGDAYSLAIGADVNYLWDVSDDFQAGVTAGYMHFLGKTIAGFKVPSTGILPLGGAARYSVSDEIKLGADVGYAVSTATGGSGSIFFAPRAQYSVSEAMDLVLSYKSFDGLATINFGVEIGL